MENKLTGERMREVRERQREREREWVREESEGGREGEKGR